MQPLSIVVPAKDPGVAKRRLSPLLSAEARRAFAMAMFRQTLAFFRSQFAELPLLVVTDAEELAEAARQAGGRVLTDDGSGLGPAIAQATAWSMAEGFQSQLIVPADIAVLSREEFVLLLSQPRPSASVIICPSADGAGTNALLTTPPDIIPHRYGPNSFAAHVEAARAQSVAVQILDLPGLALDLDTPADLRRYYETAPPGPLRSELDRWGIHWTS
jgi:2-phospho-L-lactate guanylyltransferase